MIVYVYVLSTHSLINLTPATPLISGSIFTSLLDPGKILVYTCTYMSVGILLTTPTSVMIQAHYAMYNIYMYNAHMYNAHVHIMCMYVKVPSNLRPEDHVRC